MKAKLFLALVTALLLRNAPAADIPYQDHEFGCVTREEADRYVADFRIDVNSFGGQELCNAAVDTKKLLNDIRILEQGAFNSAGQNVFIRGFVPADGYYQWLKQETRGIRRRNDIPYATAYNSGGYFTMQDGWAKLSTLGRVGTFVHEARHTAGYRHIYCTQGPYQDSSVSGCDSNYNYGGSHAVEMEYYARVSIQGANFHPVYKKMARLMAIARSNAFFNTPVVRPHEAVLALTVDGREAHLFDGPERYVREVPAAAGRLKRTSFGGVLFDGLRAFSIELYENSGFPDLVADTYSYFKLLAETAEPVRDFEEFDQDTKRYVVKISQQNRLAAYNFPAGTWGREQALAFSLDRTSTALPGRPGQGLYLISTTGEIYNYAPQTQKITRENGLWPAEVQEVIAHDNGNLVLLKSGQIMVMSAEGLTPWSETNELYSGLISTPVYDGFEVKRE